MWNSQHVDGVVLLRVLLFTPLSPGRQGSFGPRVVWGGSIDSVVLTQVHFRPFHDESVVCLSTLYYLTICVFRNKNNNKDKKCVVVYWFHFWPQWPRHYCFWLLDRNRDPGSVTPPIITSDCSVTPLTMTSDLSPNTTYYSRVWLFLHNWTFDLLYELLTPRVILKIHLTTFSVDS